MRGGFELHDDALKGAAGAVPSFRFEPLSVCLDLVRPLRLVEALHKQLHAVERSLDGFGQGPTTV